jgi:hypothetical protein
MPALEVKPNKWWRRPFYGGGLLINFGVELEDVQQLPLPQDMPRGRWCGNRDRGGSSCCSSSRVWVLWQRSRF